MLIRRGRLRTDIDARIRYTLEPRQAGTHVRRELDLTMNLPGLFRLASPYILWAFRKENVRTLAKFKQYAEQQRS